MRPKTRNQLQELSHPFSTARALLVATFLYQYRREVRLAQKHVDTLLDIARTQDFAAWIATAGIMQGWVLAMQGEEKGVAKIQQGLQGYLAVGSRNGYSYHLSLLTEAYIRVGEPEKGLRVVNEALFFVNETGECIHEADLYRLKGSLLLQQSSDNTTEAESCFYQALSVARRQQAQSLELRAIRPMWGGQN